MRSDDFERLYAEHAPGLFSFLAYRTGDRALAEDLMADTFERAYRARRRFDRRRGSEKTWLYGIALNRLRDHWRHAGGEARALERLEAHAPEPLPAAHDTAGGLAAAVERRDLVARALATLGEPEREVVALRFGGGLTVPEIARLRRLPLTTVEGRLYRALHRLRQDLE